MSKISEEELKEINALKAKVFELVNETGQYALQIKLLKADIFDLENKIDDNTVTFKKVLEEEKAVINRLSDKYGAGSIDFETGEFTPEK